MMNKKQVSITLDSLLLEKLRAMAKTEQRSLSGQINYVLRMTLDNIQLSECIDSNTVRFRIIREDEE